jgi:hypothetical protein
VPLGSGLGEDRILVERFVLVKVKILKHESFAFYKTILSLNSTFSVSLPKGFGRNVKTYSSH